MPYYIAGIDVHTKMLAVAVADVAVDGDFHFERLKIGTSPVQLRALADWLVEREVDEVVMESTAQYWRPVCEALEQYWRLTRRTRADTSPGSGTLHLAQAQSNRAAGGRKRDFPDAERLVKRLVAQELILSFVPDAEQRLWRTVMRRKCASTAPLEPLPFERSDDIRDIVFIQDGRHNLEALVMSSDGSIKAAPSCRSAQSVRPRTFPGNSSIRALRRTANNAPRTLSRVRHRACDGSFPSSRHRSLADPLRIHQPPSRI